MSIDWHIETLTDRNVYIDHHEAVRSIRTEKRHRGEMLRAALYTYRLCYVTRRVGPAPDQISSQDYAAELGYAKSYVTLLRRLGRALVIHEVKPDSELFSVLTRAATRKEVARLLERDEKVSHDVIWRAIDEHASHLKSRRGQLAANSTTAEELLRRAAQAVREELPTANDDRLQDFEAVLGDLFFEVRQQRQVGDPQGQSDR